MKKNIIITIITLTILFNFTSCNKADELPPVKEGYSTEYIMPEAEFLTEEDRAFIEAQENEYLSSINNP